MPKTPQPIEPVKFFDVKGRSTTRPLTKDDLMAEALGAEGARSMSMHKVVDPDAALDMENATRPPEYSPTPVHPTQRMASTPQVAAPVNSDDDSPNSPAPDAEAPPAPIAPPATTPPTPTSPSTTKSAGPKVAKPATPKVAKPKAAPKGDDQGDDLPF